MKPVRTLPAMFSALLVTLLMVVLASGCSKKCDDHAQPADNSSNTGATRSAAGYVNEMDGARPGGGAGLRDAEFDGEDLDGDGISDDGDDEADGEGSNKKGRQ